MLYLPRTLLDAGSASDRGSGTNMSLYMSSSNGSSARASRHRDYLEGVGLSCSKQLRSWSL